MPKHLNKTKISWCDYTWNPITGCSKISDGCKHCYAHAMAKRFGWSMDIQFHPERLDAPSKLKKPSKIFVCSMGDIFHEDVAQDDANYIDFMVAQNPQHVFLYLTKRPEIALRYFREYIVGFEHNLPNRWLGVTVENDATKHRIDTLRKIPAAKRFISFEPLLEDVGDLDLEGIDWVIVGGETGPGARVMCRVWLDNIYFQCRRAGVPFFFKQWGAAHDRAIGFNALTAKQKKISARNMGHILRGKTHHNWPNETPKG